MEQEKRQLQDFQEEGPLDQGQTGGITDKIRQDLGGQ